MFDVNIKRAIGTVLEADNYKTAPYLTKGYAYYTKRHSEKLGFYIRCGDNRKYHKLYDHSITIDMYFTGIMTPDDGLIDSFAGIHVEVFKIYNKDVTDELITAAGEKAIAIEKYIANAAETVLDELMNPFFIGKGYSNKLLVYSETLRIYDALKNDEMIKDEIAVLEKECYEAFKKKEHEKGAALCGGFLKNLPLDYFMKKEGCQLKGISASSLGLPSDYLMKKEIWHKNIKEFLGASLFDYINAQAIFG